MNLVGKSIAAVLRPLLWASAAMLAALLNSCSWSDDTLRSQFNKRDDITVSYEQLRLRMRSLVDPMGGQIERSANQIIATNSDPLIQRAAIEWKAQGIPALRESLFQPNPMTALFDTWVLLFQMEQFYQTGDGASAMKSAAPSAVAAIRQMEKEYHQIVEGFTVSGDVTEGRSFGRKWAGDHPVQGSLAFRESTLTRAGEVDLPDGFSATGAIADITYTVDDLNRRIEIYSDQAIRQARWEAELLTMDLTQQLSLHQAMPLAESAVGEVGELSNSVEDVASSLAVVGSAVERIVPIVDRLAKVAETTPKIISAERTAAIEAAQLEITRAIETVQQERAIALTHVTDERMAPPDAPGNHHQRAPTRHRTGRGNQQGSRRSRHDPRDSDHRRSARRRSCHPSHRTLPRPPDDRRIDRPEGRSRLDGVEGEQQDPTVRGLSERLCTFTVLFLLPYAVLELWLSTRYFYIPPPTPLE